MKRYLAVWALTVVTGIVAAPAFAAEVFQTATLGASSSGSYSIGSDGSDLGNMVGAAFVVPTGQSLSLTGVGATFDGNYNLVPGSGEQKIFVAIVALSDGAAMPSFAPSDIAARTPQVKPGWPTATRQSAHRTCSAASSIRAPGRATASTPASASSRTERSGRFRSRTGSPCCRWAWLRAPR